MAQKSKPLDRPPRSRSKATAKTSEPTAHPEEMLASGEVQIGKYINLKGSARITPAGLICAGITGVTVLLAATMLVRAARR
jgi:hypothetical protein